jgi:hypothetical protein
MKRDQFVAPKNPRLIRCTNAGAVLKRHSPASLQMHFFNNGLLGLTRMGKQKNHGVYSLRKWSGFFSNPLASKLPNVFSKTPPSRQAGHAPCFFWMPILGTFLPLAHGAKSRAARGARERCVFTIPASSLVKGFEKAAPAQGAWASPCVLLLSVPIRVIRGSKLSAPNPVK